MQKKTKPRVGPPQQRNIDRQANGGPKLAPPQPVCLPVVQSPPAQSSTDSALPNSNSSFVTAESDEPSPTAAPSTAAATDAASTHAPIEALGLAELTQAAFEAALLPPTRVPASDASEVPAPDEGVGLAAAAGAEVRTAADPQPLPQVSADSAVAAAEAPAAAAPEATGWPGCFVDWLLRTYTYPVYLAAGVTVGLVTGVLGVAGRKSERTGMS